MGGIDEGQASKEEAEAADIVSTSQPLSEIRACVITASEC